MGVVAGVVIGCWPLNAQTTRARALPAGQPALDGWIVTHFHGAGLLPDTTLPTVAPAPLPGTSAPSALSAPSARIESVRSGDTVDTLWAVSFATKPNEPGLPASTSVRVSGPSGVITTVTARIVVRRLFRAPRRPELTSADTSRDPSGATSGWRYGWGYLAVMPHDASRRVARYRSWLLTMPPARPLPPSSTP